MIILLLVYLGLVLGSFINALVWRTHQQLADKDNRVHRRKYSILFGRSMCTHCHHQLKLGDLVPVLSWLYLRGKCRYCKQPIHWQYPLVEILMAGLLTASYIFWPYSFSGEGMFRFVMWAILLVVLLALFVSDLRWMLLPDRLTLVLLGLAMFQILIVTVFYHRGMSVFIDASVGVLCLAGFFYLLFHISGGKWIGGGDVKLGVGLGILTGNAANALSILFLASVIGTLVAIGLIVANKTSRKAQIPFGPFLITATIIVQLFGSTLTDWYQSQFLLI